MIGVQKPRFRLGRIVATPRATDALAEAQTAAWTLVARHAGGDFGEVGGDDWQANLDAIRAGDRILSAYTAGMGVTVWVMTEADRSSTCVLLPEDY